ncbi:low molecular weight protein-tyrosine-phosphatase [Aquitalea magnusonii]|uniref:protein-tyrosine-phosphatase n=1 Tax=Aquitalea magnusonii TaxID=332411 RepID=A0A318JLS3_9NEIS|nr:low molecular weight protein-tyrosine-phosphatase [Aquitalea magnusonii]PXX50682.1 protein tyrosine phosphatase [Aquitalea magnusonii]
MKQHYAVLMVCMGNICRSPTAEGVLRAHVQQAGLDELVTVDSAGTHAYHIGEAPDPRSCKAALQRGYDLSAQRARQVTAADFQRFDLILAADRANMAALRALCPPGSKARLDFMLAPLAQQPTLEVPDPYYGGPGGFDRVLDLIEQASALWVDQLRQTLRAAAD